MAREKRRGQVTYVPTVNGPEWHRGLNGATNHATGRHMKGGLTACQNSLNEYILPTFQSRSGENQRNE